MYPVLQGKEGQRFIQILFASCCIYIRSFHGYSWKRNIMLSVPKFVCQSEGKKLENRNCTGQFLERFLPQP